MNDAIATLNKWNAALVQELPKARAHVQKLTMAERVAEAVAIGCHPLSLVDALASRAARERIRGRPCPS